MKRGSKAPWTAVLVVVALAAPGSAAAHGRPAVMTERALQRMERAVLGPEHAAEHARERRALRHARAVWLRHTPRERRRILARAAATSRLETGLAAGVPDQVGRWETTRIPFPTYAINAVMMPTGRVLFWGRSPLKSDQTRNNDTPAYVWDPAKGAAGFTSVRPPNIVIGGNSVQAPLFCSGQSLLPSGEVLATGGTLAYPVYDSGGNLVSDFKGLDRAFTFDPWSLKWTAQPAMRKGRWYPSQALLADGRIAILAGWDGSGTATDNPDLEVFTPSPVRGGHGTMTRYANAARPGTSYYPHLFTMPDGRLLLGGSEPGESALLDPARLSNTTGAAPAWSDLPDIAGPYRYSASAVLLPAGPAGSSRVAILGGLRATAPVNGRVFARTDAELIDTRAAAPAWHRDDSAVPPLNTARSYFNVVLLPDGTLASVGGAAGKSTSDGSPTQLNSYTGGSQELKHIELRRPGSRSWTIGPAQRKWRTYHSVALLLPDGRVLSAGDDYWDLNDQADPYARQGATADEAEIYEPPYLFDGGQPAPRPTITGGPATAAWGDDLGVTVSEAPGRPASRAVLVAPSAVTHGVDMNQRHVELSVLGRVPGKGLNLRMPASPNIAPPGWYMLFVLDSTGTPSVARWVQLRAGAPDAPTLAPDQPAAPAPSAPVVPASDHTPPRASVRARRLARGARTARLLIRANEPATLTVKVRVGRRTIRARLRLTRAHLQRTLVVRLRTADRRRLAGTGRLGLRVTLAATDASGNTARRTVRVALRVRRAATG